MRSLKTVCLRFQVMESTEALNEIPGRFAFEGL